MWGWWLQSECGLSIRNRGTLQIEKLGIEVPMRNWDISNDAGQLHAAGSIYISASDQEETSG